MVRKIKQKVRDRMEEKYDALYKKEWDETLYSYENWLRQYQPSKEEVYQTKEYKQLRRKVYLMTWNELEKITDISNIYRGFGAENREIIVFTQSKEGLTEDALDRITAAFLENPEVKVVYGDEDEINSNETERMNPWFKPDYSPDTLLSYFYFGSVVAFRKEALKDIILEKQWTAKEKLYSLTLQACILLPRNQVYHCKEMLYTSHAISYWGWEDSYQSLKEKPKNMRPKVKEDGVSIIIPSKDNPEVLGRCLESIVKWTKDVEYEIVVVDNGSNPENKKKVEEMKEKLGFRYIYNPMEFNFSIMCNIGAENSQKNILLFLNDDCEVRQSKWLRKLTDHVLVRDTGAVGVKLYYPNSKMIQHCGVYSLYVGPVHKLQFKEDNCCYYDRRNLDVRNVLAATGACLIMRKEVFEEVNRFDVGLRVAFNDVDLCYKIYKAGYNNIVDNEIHLWHHESLSRGNDNASPEKIERHKGERIGLYERHKELWNGDPYYHPGFTSYYLDTNYSFAYEYETDRKQVMKKEPEQLEKPIELEALPKKIREDNCLVPMIEYAGNIKEWYFWKDEIDQIIQRTGTDQIAYMQGNMVVLGSNNACYEKAVLLRHEISGKFYKIVPKRKPRPDLLNNIPDQKNVALSGFAFLLDLRDLPKGNYEIGALAKDMISGQYLLRTTAMKLKNEE